MELVNDLFTFFGFSSLTTSTTFPEFIEWFLKCGLGVWLVMFIIRSIFMVIRTPEIRF